MRAPGSDCRPGAVPRQICGPVFRSAEGRGKAHHRDALDAGAVVRLAGLAVLDPSAARQRAGIEGLTAVDHVIATRTGLQLQPPHGHRQTSRLFGSPAVAIGDLPARQCKIEAQRGRQPPSRSSPAFWFSRLYGDGLPIMCRIGTGNALFPITSVPTLIEQIQLVRRFLREVLKGSVLKQA
jgi:hypothetical protein